MKKKREKALLRSLIYYFTVDFIRKLYIVKQLTVHLINSISETNLPHFFPMFLFDNPESVRKLKVDNMGDYK